MPTRRIGSGVLTNPSWSGESYERGSNLTVTDEVSCNVVRPHRLRSGKYLLNDSDFGANGPNLSGFPLLTGGTEGQSTTSTADAGKRSPKMLAVPYNDVDCNATPKDTRPFSFIGSTKYEACSNGQDLLDMSPRDRSRELAALAAARATCLRVNGGIYRDIRGHRLEQARQRESGDHPGGAARRRVGACSRG
ncbi:MAG: hypothetical protein QM784_18215 [Polyangiaceae bacterium]